MSRLAIFHHTRQYQQHLILAENGKGRRCVTPIIPTGKSPTTLPVSLRRRSRCLNHHKLNTEFMFRTRKFRMKMATVDTRRKSRRNFHVLRPFFHPSHFLSLRRNRRLNTLVNLNFGSQTMVRSFLFIMVIF